MKESYGVTFLRRWIYRTSSYSVPEARSDQVVAAAAAAANVTLPETVFAAIFLLQRQTHLRQTHLVGHVDRRFLERAAGASQHCC